MVQSPNHGSHGNGLVTVAVINDVELVVRGLCAMLNSHRDKIQVVEALAGGMPDTPIDVALFDTFTTDVQQRRVESLMNDQFTKNVVLYSWNVAHLLRAADDDVRVSFVSKSCDTETLVGAILRAAQGKRVVELGIERSEVTADLSNRESEILALIANGLTNHEIAQILSLSTETIKTYAERMYQKIGVRNRTQAAVHATQLGLVRALPI